MLPSTISAPDTANARRLAALHQAQAFAAEVLGIKESQERFNEIKIISSGLSIEFLPRRNSNLEIIIEKDYSEYYFKHKDGKVIMRAGGITLLGLGYVF